MASISVQIESVWRRLRDNITEYVSRQHLRAAKSLTMTVKQTLFNQNGNSKGTRYPPPPRPPPPPKKKIHVSFTNKTFKSDSKQYHRKTIHKMPSKIYELNFKYR